MWSAGRINPCTNNYQARYNKDDERHDECALYGTMATLNAKIGAGIAGTGLLSTLPFGLAILRPVPAPTVTLAFLMPGFRSPPTREREPVAHSFSSPPTSHYSDQVPAPKESTLSAAHQTSGLCQQSTGVEVNGVRLPKVRVV